MSKSLASKKGKTPSIARPSSSVLLISPKNHILLLHRVQTSSSFPAAHVFPGGNVDEFHDGKVPDVEDVRRHEDNQAYRMAAIRETFEESGILLARNNGFGRLIEVADQEREQGRRAIHKREIAFSKWLAGKGGRPDLDGLLPFTRWITPSEIPKRYTTQMYLYFLPLSQTNGAGVVDKGEALIPDPTSDGGIEHTTATFMPPWKWIDMQKRGEIILFPPQLFLLTLIAPFLSPSESDIGDQSSEEFAKQRQRLREFLKAGEPPWAEKVISPHSILLRKIDGRSVLSLEKPGRELENTGRRGDQDRVALVKFTKEGPRNVEIAWKKDILDEERAHSRQTHL